MCLSKRFRGSKYSSEGIFLKDVKLIVNNALAYYSDPDDRVHSAAKELMVECISALDKAKKGELKVPTKKTEPASALGKKRKKPRVKSSNDYGPRVGGRNRSKVARFDPSEEQGAFFWAGLNTGESQSLVLQSSQKS